MRQLLWRNFHGTICRGGIVSPGAILGQREGAQCRLLVRKIGKNGVQVGHMQNFPGPRTQVHSVKLYIIPARGIQSPDQLPDSRTIEVGDITKIKEDLLSAVLKQVHQQLVNRLTFDQSEPASHVHHGNAAQLPRARTETHYAPPVRLLASILPQAGEKSKCEASSELLKKPES